jgi:Spy/CpxP family protein refolding chaperone
MSFRNKLTNASLTLALSASFGAFAYAQQTPTPPPDHGFGKPHNRMGERPEGMGGMRFFRELDLTDAQKQQARAIMERYEATNKPLREELRGLRQQKDQGTLTAEGEARAKTLRSQLFESSKNLRSELLAILTPDQRTKLEQLEKEHKNDPRREKRERPADGQNGVQ